MTVSPSREAFLLRIERTMLNTVRREAQSREISVTDMFVEIIKSYDFTGQREQLKPSNTKPWWN
jgi:hypothetical protein|tara:strand:- start:1386 stop:1577 length:192 start_codon:yes stop_codon:yes gene_type:complete